MDLIYPKRSPSILGRGPMSIDLLGSMVITTLSPMEQMGLKVEREKMRMWSAGNRGFSFIELTVVLILISLSIALVAPYLSKFSKSVELKACSQRIAAILRNYRSEAVNRGKVYQVVFDSSRIEVRIQPVVEEGEEGRGEKKDGREIKTYKLPLGVQMKEIEVGLLQYPSDFPAIEFYPNGGSNGGKITIDTQGHEGYRIKVNFLTGNVTIEKV